MLYINQGFIRLFQDLFGVGPTHGLTVLIWMNKHCNNKKILFFSIMDDSFSFLFTCCFVLHHYSVAFCITFLKAFETCLFSNKLCIPNSFSNCSGKGAQNDIKISHYYKFEWDQKIIIRSVILTIICNKIKIVET